VQGWTVPGPIALVTGFGWAGVDLFFVLSGFLITGLLLDARHRPDYYRRFYARRARRIFPLYLLYVAVLAVVAPGAWLPWYLTYTLNVRIALANGWAPAVVGTAFFWSLCVEEQFYALWPAVVRRLDDRTLVRLCGVLAVVALLARLWAVRAGHPFAAYVLLPARMDGQALGAAVAVLSRHPGGLDRLARWAPGATALAALALAALIARTHYAGWDTALMQTVGYTSTAVASIALLVLAVARRAGVCDRLTMLAPLRYAGRRAYGLYVLSGVAALLAEALGLPHGATTVLGVALAFVLAEASWHLIERPALEGRWLAWRRAPVQAS
jgi:peptidoglycan/LPS O-acetylase OafA/YrhL